MACPQVNEEDAMLIAEKFFSLNREDFAYIRSLGNLIMHEEKYLLD